MLLGGTAVADSVVPVQPSSSPNSPNKKAKPDHLIDFCHAKFIKQSFLTLFLGSQDIGRPLAFDEREYGRYLCIRQNRLVRGRDYSPH